MRGERGVSWGRGLGRADESAGERGDTMTSLLVGLSVPIVGFFPRVDEFGVTVRGDAPFDVHAARVAAGGVAGWRAAAAGSLVWLSTL